MPFRGKYYNWKPYTGGEFSIAPPNLEKKEKAGLKKQTKIQRRQYSLIDQTTLIVHNIRICRGFSGFILHPSW